ncbi:hypothetical protein ABIF61_004359 [Bradyrhizobium japonicum]
MPLWLLQLLGGARPNARRGLPRSFMAVWHLRFRADSLASSSCGDNITRRVEGGARAEVLRLWGRSSGDELSNRRRCGVTRGGLRGLSGPSRAIQRSGCCFESRRRPARSSGQQESRTCSPAGIRAGPVVPRREPRQSGRHTQPRRISPRLRSPGRLRGRRKRLPAPLSRAQWIPGFVGTTFQHIYSSLPARIRPPCRTLNPVRSP